MARREGVETVITGPWIVPRSSVDMDEIEFTERTYDHLSGRRRWPVVISLAIDIVARPEEVKR